MYAKVTAYRGFLVCELLTDKSIKDAVATSLDSPSMGQVIMDSAKNLGVSQEALQLLKQVPVGSDSMGDLDWFQSGAKHCFGWLGGPYSVKRPADCQAARNWAIGPFVSIANDVPEGAKPVVDEMLGQPGAPEAPAAATNSPDEQSAQASISRDKASLLTRICRELELSRSELKLLNAALS